MPVFKVHVKWGKENFRDIECDTAESLMVFKAQLFALSGVAPDRQKVMVRGKTLRDEDWDKTPIKDGMKLLMMGSADELPTEPAVKPLFMEDMSEQQLATALAMPAGLHNLGNTCYMNATLQCLKSVPELRQSLQKLPGTLSLGGVAMNPADSLTKGMRDLFSTMENSGTSIPPIVFVQALHMAFPRFAEKSEQGGFAQQDANECWTELVRCLQQKLPALDPPQSQPEGASSTKGFMDQYFAGQFDTTMKCVESEEEAVTKSTETFYQLSCFIEKEVKYMETGLKSRLEEHITKTSPSLGRDAVYQKSSKLNRLPAYLSIQFVRFYFKEKESINAKVLKDVKFTMTLDVYDLCTAELQAKLMPMRDKFKADSDAKVEEARKIKAEEEEKPVKKVVSSNTEDDENLKKLPYWFEEDIGSNNSGFYELSAVLTHKGRSSSSGHYVAWVKRKGDEWLMFDDDKVHAVTSEDILKLSGGGDWHCAYVLLYAPKVLSVPPETKEKSEETSEEKAEEKMET